MIALKNIVEVCKDSLDHVFFNNIDLSYTNLDRANIKLSDLNKANCIGSSFNFANLEKSQFIDANMAFCSFWGADLQGTWFLATNLAGSSFLGADLRKCRMMGSNVANAGFEGASFIGADLRYIKNYTIEQLSKAHSFYNAIMDSSLEDQLKKKYPQLFIKPIQEIVEIKSINTPTKY
jgi:uncharacterized protein YjbI with pentapeptide repeats